MPKSRRRGQIIPKGPSTFLVRVHAGNHKYLSETVQGSSRDAEKVLTRLLRERDTSMGVLPPSQVTVGDFLDRWLDAKATEVAPKTHADYAALLRKHVRPRLGQLRLDKVTPMLLQDLISTLSKGGLGPRMVQYCATVLSQAFKCAVQWRLLPQSPAMYLKVPPQERKERRILTPEECRRLLSSTAGSPWHALWTILLSTGLRPHEALALRWEDITPDGRIVVARGLRQVAPGKYEVAETKTAGSKRSLWVPTEVLATLEGHRRAQDTISPWVFRNREGNPWDISKVRKAWYRDLKAAGLPRVTLYTARHSHLSHLVMATGSLKVAQERAGHSTIRITADTYTHLLDETRKGTAEVVQGVLWGSSENR